jgi:hypothetical protein
MLVFYVIVMWSVFLFKYGYGDAGYLCKCLWIYYLVYTHLCMCVRTYACTHISACFYLGKLMEVKLYTHNILTCEYDKSINKDWDALVVLYLRK